ncbi:hypothetical protein ACIA5C_19720 [Actinoplanes sp. NPDC051343]|uniref:hypothetical protein n=1 Tax=Actinoplanes sp. NPDC051343 TaxID=3363906 RepID=UPI0037B29361
MDAIAADVEQAAAPPPRSRWTPRRTECYLLSMAIDPLGTLVDQQGAKRCIGHMGHRRLIVVVARHRLSQPAKSPENRLNSRIRGPCGEGREVVEGTSRSLPRTNYAIMGFHRLAAVV